MAKGGQIFQGNTTPVDDLIKALEHPEDYPHLIVRVGGYSARFTTLHPSLQEEIISRARHGS
jgi:formate C-acetyltransferase